MPEQNGITYDYSGKTIYYSYTVTGPNSLGAINPSTINEEWWQDSGGSAVQRDSGGAALADSGNLPGAIMGKKDLGSGDFQQDAPVHYFSRLVGDSESQIVTATFIPK